jgi:RsiW-degrading membrane proteinase PrsW (M82 family)
MSVAIEELDATRTAALDASGWGRSFKFFQPRNLAFWVYVWFVVNGAYVFGSYIASYVGAYGQAIAVSAVFFGFYGALLWWFTVRIDRYSSQPGKLLVAAFAWGGFAATWMIAANANTPILTLYSKAFGQAWALNWGPGLTAPFTEELAKGAGLLLLVVLAPRVIRTAYDGFIVGAFLGLGFQVLENVQYSQSAAGSQFGANQIGASAMTVIVRALTGLSGHILYSAIFGAGLIYLLGTPGEPRRRVRGLALMLLALLLHGVWDAQGGLLGPFGALLNYGLVLFPIIFIVIVVFVFKMTVPREREYMREVMAPEVARGVITTAELDALSGNRKARKAYRKSGSGHHAHVRARRVLDASYDLADELAKASGTGTDRVEFARSEVRRLRQE